MSRYRSELYSLLVRIRDIERELHALDRERREGLYARTAFARGMYLLGRAVARAFRRLRGSRATASDVDRARARLTALERRLEDRLAGNA